MLVALAANLVIAVAKTVAAIVSGSAAMYAETAHSFADTTNQVLLLVSIRRGAKPADLRHPMGYGRERFFWALLAAVFIFVGGALFSVSQGVLALATGSVHEGFVLGVVILAISVVAESLSLVRALRHAQGEARTRRTALGTYISQSTDPTVRTVLFEDTAAVVGASVALAGITLHRITGDAWWDAGAAIAVGGVLGAVAIALGVDARALLVGESALPPERASLRSILHAQSEIDEVHEVVTTHIGPAQLAVAARVTLHPGVTVREIEAMGRRVRESMRDAVDDVATVFIDPTTPRLPHSDA